MSTARASFLSAPRCISQTITFADFTESSNNTPETVNLTEKLPAKAIVLQRWLTLNTEFSGGGLSTCTADLGWSADADGWYDGENVFTGATAGIKAVPSTPGARIAGSACDVDDAIRTVGLKLIPDAGHNLAAMTAGSISVNVIYVIEAADDLIKP